MTFRKHKLERRKQIEFQREKNLLHYIPKTHYKMFLFVCLFTYCTSPDQWHPELGVLKQKVIPHVPIVTMTQKRVKDRTKGNGCRFCLGDRIYSITFCSSFLYNFEEQDESILFFKSSWCNSPYSSNRPNTQQLALQGNE